MQYQSGSSSNGIGDTECTPRDIEIVLDLIIHETKGENHGVDQSKDEHKTSKRISP